MIYPRLLHIQDSSHPGEARRLVLPLCRELGFQELRGNQVALVVTELASNLVKHTEGKGGELIICPVRVSGLWGLDLLSLDQGPGITNINQSLQDGFSTTQSYGQGLGTICRLSSVFDLFSRPGQGTAVFSRIWAQNWPDLPFKLDTGAICLPVQYEEACGDAWAMLSTETSTHFILADGLGHGPEAATAANLAISIFEQCAPRSPADLLQMIHAGLRGTRGAAIAIIELAAKDGVLRFAGVGNITGMILSGSHSRKMISHNGTAGVEARKIQEFSYPWPENGLLILHSDGMTSHWSMENYPGLLQKQPTLIAGVLYRDHQRLRDDTTIVMARASAAGIKT